ILSYKTKKICFEFCKCYTTFIVRTSKTLNLLFPTVCLISMCCQRQVELWRQGSKSRLSPCCTLSISPQFNLPLTISVHPINYLSTKLYIRLVDSSFVKCSS